ncbi:MAG: DNA ligase D [Dehalococcoidia bacterium]
MPDALDRYREMRDFAKTAEPDGEIGPPPGSAPRFVIQEHHATALHWDFRLEHEGVLVSWAVPKGLPADPETNHLAIHTEDHPLAYHDFEGEIPEGEYGGGRVILWDRGTYDLHKFRDREVMVTLHGGRIQGKYVLFRTGDDPKQWMIHRMDPPQDAAREPMPAGVEPMLARLASMPAKQADYGFEIKWDGVRAIAYVRGGRVRLQSRRMLDSTKQYPELQAMGASLGAREVILDGEIIAFDEAGVPRFERLQERMNLAREFDIRRKAREIPIVYMVFDVLYLDGRSTMGRPYRERRRLLDELALSGPNWQTPPMHEGEGPALLAATKAQGLEGVVGKRLDSPYEPGRRSESWLKIKNSLRQEFVVGGWTPGAGARDGTIGALLLGYYDVPEAQAKAEGREQRLHYAGKVGSGFNAAMLRTLESRLQRLRLEASPFAVGVPEPEARFVEPVLVAEVDFLEWTEGGTLRHPSFEGLRTDKEARDVVLESETTWEAPPTEAVVVARPSPGLRGRRASSTKQTESKVAVAVDGRDLVLSNLEKVLYPAAGFTKAEVIDYYTKIAAVMVPHTAGRPMTLKRYPNGVDADFFYEKECPSHRPGWVETSTIYSGHNDRDINYVLVNDRPTLVWLANLAALELHPLLSRVPELSSPTAVVFDLDPGPPAGILECARVALWLKDLFEALGLSAVVKTSGSKGMQVYLPLNTPATFDDTKSFANGIARLLERQHPREVVSSMSKTVRTGKVFVDWSQNDDHKTTISVYSLRARERPFVSAPVTWDEVAEAARTSSAKGLAVEAGTMLERVAERGDLFEPMNTLRQTLPSFGA